MEYNDYEKMFMDEYKKMLYPDVEEMAFQSASETPQMLRQAESVIKPLETSKVEDALSAAGIKLRDVNKFLEELGSINIAGIDFTLRDLMPLDEGVISALELAGSGQPMTTGKGMTTGLDPRLGAAAAEIGTAVTLAKPLEAGLKNIAKKVAKNKAKTATALGAALQTTSKKDEGK
jgi:hypothetical protein